MVNENKISILIPVYNTDKYLAKCIESVLNQTYKNLEIIIIDDGSTDRSGEICDTYLEKDNRIKVIHQENSCRGNALNNGLRIATGKFVGFVDCDDYIEPDMYETLLDALCTHDADIAECGFFKVWRDEIKKYHNCHGSGKITLFDNCQAIEALLSKKLNSATWNKIYKMNLVADLKFPYVRFCGDEAWIYKVFARSRKIVYLDLAKYYYLQRDGSLINSLIRWEKLELFYIFKERLEFINGSYPALFNFSQKNFFIFLIKYFRKLGMNDNLDKVKKNRSEIQKYLIENYESFYSNPLMNKKNKALLKIFKVSPGFACNLYYFYKKLNS
jgi:glycosyltransferase involved in cell wall biosynthesis